MSPSSKVAANAKEQDESDTTVRSLANAMPLVIEMKFACVSACRYVCVSLCLIVCLSCLFVYLSVSVCLLVLFDCLACLFRLGGTSVAIHYFDFCCGCSVDLAL